MLEHEVLKHNIPSLGDLPATGPLSAAPFNDPDNPLCDSDSCHGNGNTVEEAKEGQVRIQSSGVDCVDWEDIDLALTVPVYSFEAEGYRCPDEGD